MLAAHLDEEWLLRHNLTMVMVNSLEETQFRSLCSRLSGAGLPGTRAGL
jgi:hypothetical protein